MPQSYGDGRKWIGVKSVLNSRYSFKMPFPESLRREEATEICLFATVFF